MARKKGPSLEQILDIDVCECATVRDVIDEAVRMALEWYERRECKVKQTASLFLAVRVLQQLLVQMAANDDNANEAAKFISESRQLVSNIEEDCQPYIQQSFVETAFARQGVHNHSTVQ